jgi:hypothetical protein
LDHSYDVLVATFGTEVAGAKYSMAQLVKTLRSGSADEVEDAATTLANIFAGPDGAPESPIGALCWTAVQVAEVEKSVAYAVGRGEAHPTLLEDITNCRKQAAGSLANLLIPPASK